LADLANLYFRMSGIPIRFWSKAKGWQHWEASCFRMLNGDRFGATTTGTRTVCFDKLPGKSLWEHLNEGTLTRRMLEAAGTELRRAHQFRSDEFDGRWSHGDATATNVIYDRKTDRASSSTSRLSTIDRFPRNRDTPTIYSSFCWMSLRWLPLGNGYLSRFPFSTRTAIQSLLQN
jgi:hypothetical protein